MNRGLTQDGLHHSLLLNADLAPNAQKTKDLREWIQDCDRMRRQAEEQMWDAMRTMNGFREKKAQAERELAALEGRQI